MSTGFVVYDGPSVLDGGPIVAIATLHSSNAKTGDMIQTWIVRRDVKPTEASKEGLDVSVCGQCSLRHYLEGPCYVNLGHAPQRVWQGYQAGKYPSLDAKIKRRIRGRPIRLGAYGDPAAVPYEAWRPLVDLASMTTGYTHQINSMQFDERILEFCMVSAESELASDVHEAAGWRTFRVKAAEEPMRKGEVMCPADTHADTQCIDCGLCSGALQGGPSIAINVHGSRSKRFDLIAAA